MPLYVDLLDRRVGVNPTTAISYTSKDFPSSFPYTRWVSQQVKYVEYWNWFTGSVWDETVPGARDKTGNDILRFPLRVNLVKTAAMKHNYVLFGEAPDGPGPLVPIQIDPKIRPTEDAPDKELKRRAKELEQFINEVWTENKGRTLQLEGGLVQQFLGGIVYKLTWNPLDENLEHKIKIEMVLPDFFMPVWDSTDPDNLLEAFIIWRVPAREATLKYGYDFGNYTGSHPDYVLYIEHWTKETITITVGGKPVSYAAEVRNLDTDEVIEAAEIEFTEAENPFGFIPMVYIPRERAGTYYGLSIVDDLRGLAKEINARMADLGDVIAESSHRKIFTRNIPGAIRTRDVGGSDVAIDLGTQGPGQEAPDAFVIDPPTLAADLASYPEMLRKQFIRDAFISSVAEGEDEGSQRSALTLAFRMWPLTSKARAIRAYWENGLILLAKMIAKMAIFHGVADITPRHLVGVNFSCNWAPQIPRDREQLVNEVTLLLQANALTPYSALKALNAVPDASEEIERLKEWLEYMNQMQLDSEIQKAKIKTQVQGPVAATGLDNR